MRWLGCFFLVCLCAAIRVHTLPVDWDAGACSGGYATHIFDKYDDELVRMHLEEIVEQREFVSVEAIRGTQMAEWENRSIQLAFDVQYEYENGSVVTNRISFIGKRYWFDCFSWEGCFDPNSDPSADPNLDPNHEMSVWTQWTK